MHKIIFATGNRNKFKEASAALQEYIELVPLSDIGYTSGELAETGDTLEANALEKARYIYEKYGMNCFSEDTGLEIDALNGEPGIYSARYGGPEKDAHQNMDKVLSKLGASTERKARFRTVIALILEGREFLFEGEVPGEITQQKSGTDGFGYDPIFKPTGFEKTFADFTIAEKNAISHRGRAMKKLENFFQEDYQNL